MHKYFLLFPAIALLCAGSLQAQPQQRLNIESATVFLNCAELTSTAKINLSKGENEVLFTNVAGDVNSQSLTVSATNGVAVASATFQNNYLATEVYSPRVKEIKDSLELMAADTQLVHNKVSVLNLQIGVVRKNEQVGGQNTGLNVAELVKMEEFIATRVEGYINQRSKEEE